MAVNLPYLTPQIEQIVPGALRMSDRLSHAAVGQSRYNSLFTPITGAGGYAAGGSGTKLMTFRISSADYCDLSTLALSWLVQANVANCTAAVDESILSLVQQCTVRVGGIQIFTMTDFPAIYNALVSVSMPKSVYEQDGPAQGLYKSSRKFGGDVVVAGNATYPTGPEYFLNSNNCWDSRTQQQARKVAQTYLAGGVAGNSGAGGRYYSVPLGFLFSGLKSYFPLRNVANIEIEFLLQSSINACIVPGGKNGDNAGANVPTALLINEAELRVDMVRCSPDLYALMDSEVKEGGGVAMTFDLMTNIPFTLNSGSTTPGERALQTAQSVRYLKTVYLLTRITNNLNDSSWSKSNFGNHQFAQNQILINGVSYPQIPVRKVYDAFTEMRKAQNKMASTVGDSIIGTVEWRGPYQLDYNYGTTNPTYATASVNSVGVAPSRDGTWWGSQNLDDSRFILATNLETFLTSRDCDLDGINLAESAGSLCEVRITNAPSTVAYALDAASGVLTATATAAGPTYNVLLHHSGVLSISGGAVSFLK
jgi:hypothetical protein